MKHTFLAVGRPSVLRHANAHGLLKLLREAGPCSRADLVRASGLSAPTVTNVVKDLMEEGLIEPLGEGESSGGRPPDLIRFKAERGCLVAVEIAATRLTFLITDLDGRELGDLAIDLSGKATTPTSVCSLIAEGARALLRRNRKTREQLLVLVVAVPAIADVAQGVVMSISTMEQWRSVPLRAMLNKLVDCHVIVENDTNLAAQGEQFAGAARKERDFVLIRIGANVSAGIVMGGKIHHGSQWSAGEIAYLRLPYTSRRPPTLHEFGELESVLTTSAILKSWAEQPETLHKSSGQSRRHSKLDAAGVLGLAQDGDARAEQIVRQRAAIVADIIVNLSLILNPSLILLAGEVGAHPALLYWVQSQLEGSEFAVPRVAAGSLGDGAVRWGAISLALNSLSSVLLPVPAE